MDTDDRDSTSTREQIEQALDDVAKEYLRQWFERRAPNSMLRLWWEEFHRFHSNVLRGMAAGFGLKAHECEDVIQEVWLQVHVHIARSDWPENRSGLRFWLFTLLRNKAVDCFRRKARCLVQTVGNLDGHHAVDPASGPAERCEDPWERQLVHRLLADLKERESPTNYRLLVMRWIEQQPLGEVAQTLGLSPNAASCAQQRMFQKMRALLALYQGDGFAGASDSPS